MFTSAPEINCVVTGSFCKRPRLGWFWMGSTRRDSQLKTFDFGFFSGLHDVGLQRRGSVDYFEYRWRHHFVADAVVGGGCFVSRWRPSRLSDDDGCLRQLYLIYKKERYYRYKLLLRILQSLWRSLRFQGAQFLNLY